MKGPTPRRLLDYVRRRLRLGDYLDEPGDGRQRPQIPARTLVWALLLGRLLREPRFHGIEQLVVSAGAGAWSLGRGFSDDALAYFTERLRAAGSRRALAETVRRAKRNQAFENAASSGWPSTGPRPAGRGSRAAPCAGRFAAPRARSSAIIITWWP